MDAVDGWLERAYSVEPGRLRTVQQLYIQHYSTVHRSSVVVAMSRTHASAHSGQGSGVHRTSVLTVRLTVYRAAAVLDHSAVCLAYRLFDLPARASRQACIDCTYVWGMDAWMARDATGYRV